MTAFIVILDVLRVTKSHCSSHCSIYWKFYRHFWRDDATVTSSSNTPIFLLCHRRNQQLLHSSYKKNFILLHKTQQTTTHQLELSFPFSRFFIVFIFIGKSIFSLCLKNGVIHVNFTVIKFNYIIQNGLFNDIIRLTHSTDDIVIWYFHYLPFRWFLCF